MQNSNGAHAPKICHRELKKQYSNNSQVQTGSTEIEAIISKIYKEIYLCTCVFEEKYDAIILKK